MEKILRVFFGSNDTLHFSNPNYNTLPKTHLFLILSSIHLSFSSTLFLPLLNYIYYLYLSSSLIHFFFLLFCELRADAFKFCAIHKLPVWSSNYQTHLASVVFLP